MRAFVVLGLVFFPYKAKRWAWGNVSEMTYFVAWDVKPELSQSVNVAVQPHAALDFMREHSWGAHLPV